MKVDVIKIGKYDPSQDGKYSRYEGYCLSTSEKVDHPITSEACQELGARTPAIEGVLYHSPLLSGTQSAECIAKTSSSKLIPLAELKEVPFVLEKLVSAEEFEELGSTLVRARFVEAFVNNDLLETRQQIQDRIYITLALANVADSDNITLISHSFLMKMLEAVVKGIDVFENPDLLSLVIPVDKKTYNFGEGFTFEVPK